MDTSSTTDPMLVCPPWCELDQHDQVEQLRNLRHWRDVLTLDAESASVNVDVVKYGYRAAPAVRLGVGELIEGSTTLTVEQAEGDPGAPERPPRCRGVRDDRGAMNAQEQGDLRYLGGTHQRRPGGSRSGSECAGDRHGVDGDRDRSEQ